MPTIKAKKLRGSLRKDKIKMKGRPRLQLIKLQISKEVIVIDKTANFEHFARSHMLELQK